MTRILSFVASIALFTSLAIPAAGQTAQDEIDAYWEEAGRTIREGDFEAYARSYHDDAVLVSLQEGKSYSIHQALAGWKYLFDATRDGKATAGFEVRFTRTLHDSTTAHQTGIFRYSFVPEEGDSRLSMVHFEMLLVKKDRWVALMEFQKAPATEAEWEAAKQR